MKKTPKIKFHNVRTRLFRLDLYKTESVIQRVTFEYNARRLTAGMLLKNSINLYLRVLSPFVYVWYVYRS